jgi:hypothetical protein
VVGRPIEKRPVWKTYIIGGRIILKWILMKQNGRVWNELIQLRTGIRGMWTLSVW